MALIRAVKQDDEIVLRLPDGQEVLIQAMENDNGAGAKVKINAPREIKITTRKKESWRWL